MPSTERTSKTKEIQCDLAVIGGGGGGLAAAVEAAEHGVKNIVVLEARRIPGGNAMGPSWIFAVESPVHKRLGVHSSRDEVFKKAWDYAHWKSEPRILRALIDKSGDNIRWLEEKGLKFSLFPPVLHYQISVSGTNRTGPVVTKRLIENCKDMGVQILCETRASKLLTDRKGKVIGVLATTKDGNMQINAKAVIVSTGGGVGNEELVRKHFPTYNKSEFHHYGLPHMGEGLALVSEIGAATENMGVLEMGCNYVRGSWALSWMARRGFAIWVNKRGERFADENFSMPYAFQYSNVLYRQPGKTGFALFDEEAKQAIFKEGLSDIEAWVVGVPREVWPATVEKELRSERTKKSVKISDSWDDIAKWIGVDSRVLKGTIDEYNSFCKKGHDDIFVKDKTRLLPLNTPPYYAIQFCNILMTAREGIKTNYRMEVLNRKDSAIPGLYAAGVEISGVDGDTYDGVNLIAHSYGFALGSGRIAGENAAKYINS